MDEQMPEMAQTTACPFCGERGGFHDEDVHAARPVAYGKALPPLDEVPLCRACGLPINGPGQPGCKYPKHVVPPGEGA